MIIHASTNVFQYAGEITTVKTLADRCAWARARLSLTQGELAKRAKVTQSTIGNIESGARKAPRNLLAIARALQVRPEWLQDGEGPVDLPGVPPMTDEKPIRQAGDFGLAHAMSLQPDTVPSLTWEELMAAKELPAEFWLTLDDDAMAPRAPKGTVALFTRGKAVAVGDAVLFKRTLPDGQFEFHVRVYEQDLSRGWRASPTNPVYATLDGTMPGLEPVAVLSALRSGWAALSR